MKKRLNIQKLVEKLHSELARKGLNFKPHFWVSTEWFSPDGVPGIAVPFYLFDQRLIRLERIMTKAAEGATPLECMKILRHEAGHAIENAFGLKRLKEREALFGKTSTPYPNKYKPKAYSPKFVKHLSDSYAQAHPDEDFAETFAVWLDPRSGWRRRYKKYPTAYKKLLYMDKLMKSLRGKRPLNRTQRTVEPINRINISLTQYYRKKEKHLGLDFRYEFDPALKRIFQKSETRKTKATQHISKLERRLKKELVSATSRNAKQYDFDRLIDMLKIRARELDLKTKHTQEQTYKSLVRVLKRKSHDYLAKGLDKIPM